MAGFQTVTEEFDYQGEFHKELELELLYNYEEGERGDRGEYGEMLSPDIDESIQIYSALAIIHGNVVEIRDTLSKEELERLEIEILDAEYEERRADFDLM